MTEQIGSAEFAGLVDAASGDLGIPPGYDEVLQRIRAATHRL